MKKQRLAPFIALSIGSVVALTACTNDEQPAPDGAEALVSARYTEATEASWSHTLFLFKGNTLDQTSENKEAVFPVESGANYTMKALVVEDKSKLTFPAQLTGINDQLSVTSLASGVPQILFGVSEAATISSSRTLPVTVTRLVSKLIFDVTVPPAVSGISVKIKDLNDRITLTGTPSASAAGLSKTITLTRTAQGKFSGSVTLLPSSATTFNLEYTYTFPAGAPAIKTSTPAPVGGGAILVANEETTVTSVVTDNGEIDASTTVSYAPWGSHIAVNDNIDLTPTEVPVLMTLTASMFSTNNPMQYVTFGYTADGNWASNAAITSAQRTTRENKWGKFANLIDGNPATAYSTNFDMYTADNTWNFRSNVFVAYNHIQIDLGANNPISEFDIELTNPNGAERLKKVDYKVSADGTNFTTVGSVAEGVFNSALGAVNKTTGLKMSNGSSFRYIRIVPKDGATTVGSFYNSSTNTDRYAGYFGVAEIKLWKITR